MCGRFVGYSTLDDIRAHFAIDSAPDEEIRANYNVAPTQQVLVVVQAGGERILRLMHWGLVPFWAEDPSIGSRMINARSETAAEKPAFKAAFRKRRCLVVNDGFYEWTGPRGKKQPVFIRPADVRGPFAFAGLWESWKPKAEKSPSEYASCTILTTEAAASIRPVHHRMPVVLSPDGYGGWLDPAESDAAHLGRILAAHTCREFETTPVATQVNSPSNNDPSLIDPVEESPP